MTPFLYIAHTLQISSNMAPKSAGDFLKRSINGNGDTAAAAAAMLRDNTYVGAHVLSHQLA